ncbi:protein phosphatase 2C domain-containing protein [Streptomyces purpureus]|nr:protein phosphatase 2C domain-containing protein [Streptomyces purpureus]
MTQQGDRRTAGPDDWWDKLYDETAPDTAAGAGTPDDTRPTAGRDDDEPSPERPTAAPPPPTAPPPPPPTAPPAPPRPPRQRAPWEPPSPAAPAEGPRTFPPAPSTPPPPTTAPQADPRTGYVGDGPPTYDPEPTALPAAHPDELAELVADTVLDGARYGTYTLRAASVRGDSARYRGEPRRDALITARFGEGRGALVLVAVATGARAAAAPHMAAADACRWIGEAVGRSHTRLAEDIRAGRRGDLKSGLHRLTDRTYGRLRARATELGADPQEYTAHLRCLLLSADPDCRTRVFFGVGPGGLFRLRDGAWQDLEPALPDPGAVTGEAVVGFGSPPQDPRVGEQGPDASPLTVALGVTQAAPPAVEGPLPPPAEPFRFRASVARPGDTLLLAAQGFAEPVRSERALADALAARWGTAGPPGLAAFLADTQTRVKGYADDRTAVAVWEA